MTEKPTPQGDLDGRFQRGASPGGVAAPGPRGDVEAMGGRGPGARTHGPNRSRGDLQNQAPRRPHIRASLRVALAMMIGTITAGPASAARSDVEVVGIAKIDDAGPGVFGLSAIDYDATNDRWLLLSDDRAASPGPRFFTATLAFKTGGVLDLEVEKATTIQAPDGKPYSAAQIDPEGLRLDACDRTIVWSSEATAGQDVPSVRRVSEAGVDGGELALPSAWREAGALGARPNKGVEGLTFAGGCDKIWVALEAPLGVDGELPTAKDGAPVRFALIDTKGVIVRHVAYPLGAIDIQPNDKGVAKEIAEDNGVSEILYVDATRLLVLERTGATLESDRNDWHFHCRLYIVDLAKASDVTDINTLKTSGPTLASKGKPLFDFRAAGFDANFEGMAWGPVSADGTPRLVLVSDNHREGATTWLVALKLPTDIACGRANERCPHRD